MNLFPKHLASAILSSLLIALPVSSFAHGSLSSASSSGFGEALNSYRARHGLSPLTPDSELTGAAQAYAQEMVSNGYFSHTDRHGANPMVRATMAGCSWRSVGENLASGYTTTEQVIQGWHGSSSHRQAMLRRVYTRYGMGRVGTMWVLMFADRC